MIEHFNPYCFAVAFIIWSAAIVWDVIEYRRKK